MPDVLRKVGRYEILREVGRGAMATVYLARQPDLDRHVALKELAAFRQSDEMFVKRFVRESRVVASLSHPNIVTVHEYFEDDGAPYIAMEYLARGSLRPHVHGLSPAQIAGVLEALLAGLAHAEAHDVVHRDLKPENLMLSPEGRVKIADFGIAKATFDGETRAMLTATGAPVGTPLYMAPEQALSREVGPWTDLYAVGCIAYEMLCGAPPFPTGGSAVAILMRHVYEEPRPLRALDPSIDPALSAWVSGLLVKDPAQRTQSATRAWDALEEIVLTTLGPRWRREARIVADADESHHDRTLTPAPFGGRPKVAGAGVAATTLGDAAPTPTPTPTPPAAAAPATPAPPPAAATPAMPAPPPAHRRRLVVGVGVVAVCALAGWLLAPSRSSDAPAAGQLVASGPVSLRAPGGFRPARTPPVAGLSAPVGLAATADARQTITAGRTNASGPTLLPPGLAGAARGKTPERVRLGPYEAVRYDGLRPPGSTTALRVYAVPTSAGVASVVCAAPTADCDRVAQTLRVRDAKSFPAGASADHADEVDGTLRELADARAAGLAKARAASTPAERATAADELAGAYDVAAITTGALELSPYDERATRTLSTRLEAARDAYRRLAGAARANDAGRHAAARQAVRRAEDRAAAAVQDLEGLGYAVVR